MPKKFSKIPPTIGNFQTLVRQLNDQLYMSFEPTITEEICNGCKVEKGQKVHDRFVVNIFDSLPYYNRRPIFETREELVVTLQRSVIKMETNTNSKQDNVCKKRFKMVFETLKQQHDVECLKIVQASKVVKFLERSSKQWRVSLLPEKVLLESGRRLQLLTAESQSAYREEGEGNQGTGNKIGTVTLGNFKFQIQQPDSQSDKVPFFVLLVIDGTEVAASEVVKGDKERFVFDDTFHFHVKKGFQIKFEIYSTMFWKNPTCPSPFCWSLRQRAPQQRDTRGTRKLRFKDVNTGETEEQICLKSAFKPQGSTTMNLTTSQQNACKLQLHPESILKDVAFSFDYQRYQHRSNQGFLTVGTKSHDIVVWNRRWCSLKNFDMQIFGSPSDEVALLLFSMEKCVGSRVEEAPAEICPRSESWFIDIKRLNSNVSRYYFKADSNSEMEEWLVCINDCLEKIGK